MRLSIFTIFAFVSFGLTSSSSVTPTLEEVNLKFKNKEISIGLLNDYEGIINKLKLEEPSADIQLINTLLFKHGLINLMINKKREKFAFFDFQECLENSIDVLGSLNFGCLDKFFDIGMKFGEWRVMKDIFDRIDEGGNVKVKAMKDRVVGYENKVRHIKELVEGKNWEKCFEECKEVEKIGSHDDDIIRYKIECLSHLEDRDIEENIKNIKEEYFKLVNNEVKEVKVEDFSNFIELELFTGDKADIVIRNCLKIDNEFEKCKDLNRINFKIGKMLKIVQDIGIYYSFIYSESEENVDVERFKDIETVVEKEWREVISLLFSKELKIKNKNGLDKKTFERYGIDVDSMNNNFEILIELYAGVLKKRGYKEEDIAKSRFVQDLFKIVKQGYFEIGEYGKYKSSGVLKHRYYKKKGMGKDIVDVLRELDSYIKKKKIGPAQGVLKKLSKGMKMSGGVRKREEHVQRLLQENSRHQQHQYQQQYQQQHQQQYHQQQQQQQRSTPTVDHYAVLGVKSDASTEEIKKAYRAAMRENHPDKAKALGKSVNELEEKVAGLNNAWEVLGDAEQRAAYDRERGGAHAWSGARGGAGGEKFSFGGQRFGGFGGFGGFEGFRFQGL